VGDDRLEAGEEAESPARDRQARIQRWRIQIAKKSKRLGTMRTRMIKKQPRTRWLRMMFLLQGRLGGEAREAEGAAR
jgi:hypothetical protein